MVVCVIVAEADDGTVILILTKEEAKMIHSSVGLVSEGNKKMKKLAKFRKELDAKLPIY